MKSFTDKIIVLLILFIFSGFLITIILFATAGSNWTSLITGLPYNEKIYTYDLADVRDLSIDARSCSIFLVGSDDDRIKISCLRSEAESYDIKLSENGNLTINYQTTEQWSEVDEINWRSQNRTLIISIPNKFVGTVNASSSSGTIAVSKLELSGTLTVNSTSGKLKLTDIVIDEQTSVESLSGDIEIENSRLNRDCRMATKSGVSRIVSTQITGDFSVTSGSGSINLAETKAEGNVSLQCNSGKIECSDLGGNDIYIATGSGDISGSILGDSDKYSVVTETHNQTENQPSSDNSDKLLKVSTKSGNINIRFNEIV